MKLLVYVPALLVAGVLVGLFGRALPEAAERARDGYRRTHEAACEVLQPSQQTPLGDLPQPAPDFALKDYAGREVKLSSLRGQVVLVNFWATWCKTCVVEMPSMEKLVGRTKRANPSVCSRSPSTTIGTRVRKFFPNGTGRCRWCSTPGARSRKNTAPRNSPSRSSFDKDGNIRYYVISDLATGARPASPPASIPSSIRS